MINERLFELKNYLHLHQQHIRGHKLTKSGGNKQAPVDKHEPQSQSPERTNSSMTKSRWNFK